MRLRACLTLEETVHRRHQNKGLGAVIAQHLSWPPRILAIGETAVQFLFGRLDHDPLKHLRLVFVREGLIRLPLGREISDAGGHVQGISKGHPLPPVMRRGHWHIVLDLESEDLLAVFLG